MSDCVYLKSVQFIQFGLKQTLSLSEGLDVVEQFKVLLRGPQIVAELSPDPNAL